MYNIHSHYDNIFQAIKSIVAHRRILYLLPYGSTQPENIETQTDPIGHCSNITPQGRKNIIGYIDESPMFIFYDQEPIYGEFNYELFDYIKNRYQPPFVLVTTENSSLILEKIQKRYGWPIAYNFHHAFAANDWFRGCNYNPLLIEPAKRTLTKKYISFNRLTSGHRVYRSLLISELIKHNLLDQGYVSYNDICPEGGTYQENLYNAYLNKQIPIELVNETVNNISRAPLPLRIDYQTEKYIPNHSFVLSAVKKTQESFCYLVTETCYWDQKNHLTEKIFKPIVSRMPFVLVGPAHNLKYLRSYGFKTFGQWIDESYDDIEDPLLRMNAISQTMQKICSYSFEELTNMLIEMQSILEHNHNLFYSNQFLDFCWKELLDNLKSANQELTDPN
jgi:hypothetical protein